MLSNDEKVTTIRLEKEYMKFSAAHFTIFSSQERERLHGHNFQVSVDAVTPVYDDGIGFSYKILKEAIVRICDQLDEYVLIPQLSPHLEVVEEGKSWKVIFNGEEMLFLKTDVKMLPIRNSTVEEYSDYVLHQLLDDERLSQYKLISLNVGVSSASGQWGFTTWN